MPIDYSKWKNIEISDDEDDTHPNIDTPSLFRWRHKARLDRMAEQEKEKEEFERKKREIEERKEMLKQKLKVAEVVGEDVSKLKIEDEEVRRQEEIFRQKEEELVKKERLTPWNVDTLSKDGFSKTVINKETKLQDDNLTEEERAERYMKFVNENKAKIKHFGMLKNYDASKQYLQENPQLVCEDTANYLVVWCIDLEIEEKKDLMEHVAHQCIVMQFILELSKTLKYDPRACVNPFFSKMQVANPEYKDGFYEELNAFKARIRKRAQEKIDQAMKEAEEEERKKRLGPGGLDPVEVFESLPAELQKCFESQDVALLQEAILKLDRKEAEYHMDRCVKSGLWVPEGGKKTWKAEDDEDEGETAEEVNENELYEDVDQARKSVSDDVD